MSFDVAAQAIAATVKAVAGTPITYRRQPFSAGYVIPLTAPKGRTEFSVETQPGIVKRIESQDWFIDTAELLLNGALTLPKRGDQIDEVRGSKTYRWEVMAPGDEPVYKFCDRDRVRLRVHTSLIKVTG